MQAASDIGITRAKKLFEITPHACMGLLFQGPVATCTRDRGQNFGQVAKGGQNFGQVAKGGQNFGQVAKVENLSSL